MDSSKQAVRPPSRIRDLFDCCNFGAWYLSFTLEGLHILARRGWADDASGKIQITSAGKQIRVEVEAKTERLSFAPWSCLNESELVELASLASQLRDGLKNLEGK